MLIYLYSFISLQLGRFTGLKAAVVLGGDRQVSPEREFRSINIKYFFANLIFFSVCCVVAGQLNDLMIN